MRSRVKNYGISHARGWDLDTYEYDGDCSHDPLGEGLTWTGLTAEQATTLVATRKEWKNDNKTNWLAENKRTKRYYCKPCKRPFNTRRQLERHNGVPYHKNRVNGLKIRNTLQAKHQAKCVRQEKHYALCASTLLPTLLS